MVTPIKRNRVWERGGGQKTHKWSQQTYNLIENTLFIYEPMTLVAENNFLATKFLGWVGIEKGSWQNITADWGKRDMTKTNNSHLHS